MESSQTKDIIDIQKSVKFSMWFAVIAIIGLVGSYVVWFWKINDIPLSKDSGVWGTFGDFVGGILNPIIACLAFYWLTRSVIIQKTELAATQSVLAETQKATEEQAITQEKKRFEDTFHSLLSQFNAISQQVKMQPIIREILQASKLTRLHNVVLKQSDNGISICVKTMRQKDSDCSHYFRVLYQLLKFIMMNSDYENKSQTFNEALNKPITEHEKFYANIVRSFIDMEATRLLAINCATIDVQDSYYKYRLLLERYEFLEHIRIEGFVGLDSLADYYDKVAFGKHPTLGCKL